MAQAFVLQTPRRRGEGVERGIEKSPNNCDAYTLLLHWATAGWRLSLLATFATQLQSVWQARAIPMGTAQGVQMWVEGGGDAAATNYEFNKRQVDNPH